MCVCAIALVWCSILLGHVLVVECVAQLDHVFLETRAPGGDGRRPDMHANLVTELHYSMILGMILKYNAGIGITTDVRLENSTSLNNCETID